MFKKKEIIIKSKQIFQIYLKELLNQEKCQRKKKDKQ